MIDPQTPEEEPEEESVPPGLERDDLVDEADEESFPASDPPASGRFG